MQVLKGADRKRLSELGLTSPQITALERQLYAIDAAKEAAKPRVREVKKVISGIRKDLASANKQLAPIIDHSGSNLWPERRLAGNAILAAASQRGSGPETLDAFVRQLAEVIQFCDDALLQMPSQKRGTAGHPLIVEKILEAISTDKAGAKIKPTWSTKTPFLEVMEICYKALGMGDPKAAIEKYMRTQTGRTKNATC